MVFKPAEKHPLVADPTHAREQLGWAPEVGFEALVKVMVDADLKTLEKTEDRDGIGI